jgi:hypothetical protein
MSIKISELPSATSVGADDYIPIVQGGTTKKATESMINSVNYSTSEHIIGTWINGKPLYEQTISTEAPEVSTDGNDVNKQIYISNTIDFSFISSQIAYKTQQSFPLPYIVVATPPQRMTCRTDKISGTTKITILSNGTGFNGTTVVATIRYTKSTDTATRSIGEQTRGIELTKGEAIEEDDNMITPVEKEEEPIDEKKEEIIEPIEELKKDSNEVSGDKEDIGDEQVDEQTK